MSKAHRYRVRISLLLWVAMIFLFIIIPSSSYFVHSPHTMTLVRSLMLLTVAFTIFTFVMWIIERRRERKRLDP